MLWSSHKGHNNHCAHEKANMNTVIHLYESVNETSCHSHNSKFDLIGSYHIKTATDFSFCSGMASFRKKVVPAGLVFSL